MTRWLSTHPDFVIWFVAALVLDWRGIVIFTLGAAAHDIVEATR